MAGLLRVSGALREAFERVARCVAEGRRCPEDADRLADELAGLDVSLPGEAGRAAMACVAGAYAIAVLAGSERARARLVEALRGLLGR